MKIQYTDTDGIKGSLPEGYLGYDKATADRGRVAVGTNTGDVLIAKKSEVDSHANSTNNPHAVTKVQVGLGNVDNTADSAKVVASAGKWTTARILSLTGDVTGSVNFDGSGNASITTTVADDSHNHIISNVDGLQAALDSKAAQSNTYTKAEVDGFISTSDSAAVKLTGNQTIAGVKTFSSGIVGTLTGSITGNAATATALATARTIGGVSFNGTANINLPGVNTAGNQSTTGNSATATTLQTARAINGVAFNGSANITIADNTKLTKTNPAITGSITEQVYNLTGTAISPVNGTIQYKTVSANTTFTETLTTGQSVLLRLFNASNYTITFPTITWVGVAAPELTANCVIVVWKEQSVLYGAFVGSLV